MPGPGRPFQPGQSGNAKGRPKKDRALTAMLEAAGSKTVDTDDGRMSLKRAAIAGVWQGLTEGKIRFIDGSTLPLYSKDYIELVKFLFGHVDGPPKVEAAVTHEGGINIHVTYDDIDDLTAEAASGPVTDAP